MELIKLSKFKLQLQTLITEVRELREKERASSDQLHSYFQKQKQRDEEFCREKMELEAEVASSNERCQKLNRKVRFLEDENFLLESKHKELKDTINNILQAKEGFVKVYQESVCEMRRSIESKDRKIAMLSEKMNAQLLSFDSIRNEASSVKQVVDNAQRVVSEKEEVAKINDLETKLESNKNEFQRKDRVIANLRIQLETAKLADQSQSKIKELQETLLMKEGIIQTLISENKALRSELGMMEVTIKTIQDTMTCLDEEDRVAISLMLANQEKDAREKDKEDNRTNHDIQNWEANSHHEACRTTAVEITASPSCKEYAHITRENNNVHSCVSESAFPRPSSAHSESQPAANAPNVPGAEEKLDSECSTTQAGTS